MKRIEVLRQIVEAEEHALRVLDRADRQRRNLTPEESRAIVTILDTADRAMGRPPRSITR
jgi:hypothetical protein